MLDRIHRRLIAALLAALLAAAPAEAFFFALNGDLTPCSETTYFSVFGVCSDDEDEIEWTSGSAFTVVRITCRTIKGSGCTYRWTFRHNGADSAIVASSSGTAPGTGTGSVAVEAGDTLALKYERLTGTCPGELAACAMQWAPTP